MDLSRLYSRLKTFDFRLPRAGAARGRSRGPSFPLFRKFLKFSQSFEESFWLAAIEGWEKAPKVSPPLLTDALPNFHSSTDSDILKLLRELVNFSSSLELRSSSPIIPQL